MPRGIRKTGWRSRAREAADKLIGISAFFFRAVSVFTTPLYCIAYIASTRSWPHRMRRIIVRG
jgi:hypothetical protein